ncbi:MAG: hypothetical protein QME57_03575 [Patescibacteria group bacterium]|nr:hypothetical protein [Patescibacteria group bacterium]
MKSKIDEEQPTGERIINTYYSCGHSSTQKQHIQILNETVELDASLGTKLKSALKVHGKPAQVVKENLKGDDIDNPSEKVFKTYYTLLDPITRKEMTIQTVIYESGKLKHVHCKVCGNEWKINTSPDLKQKFICDLPQKRRIVCLRCGLNFDV